MLIRVQRYPLAWFPSDNVLDFERHIDGIFQKLMDTRPGATPTGYPAVDVAEHENESVIVVELPGIRKEDLKISLHDGTINISGERKLPDPANDAKWLRSERRTGKFTRMLTLPHEVKIDEISAELADGILRIVLPKAETARPREIQVK